jgi:hypothetical protein
MSFELIRRESEFDLTDLENPVFVTEHVTKRNYSVAYSLSTFTHRHADEIYVAGVAPRSGHAVVERWIFPPEIGSFYTDRDVASTPIGVPVTPSDLMLGLASNAPPPTPPFDPNSIFSERFVAPSGRTTPPAPIREELYRGPDFGEVDSMKVDPEGRFLIINPTGQDRILRLVLSDPPDLQILYTASDFPELVGAKLGCGLAQHSTGARAYFVGYTHTSSRGMIILEDADNDGVFENAVALPEASFNASPYAGLGWPDNFMSYTVEPLLEGL